MKKSLVFLVVLLSGSALAQNQLQVKAGQTFSTFLFRDSQDDKDESLKHISTNVLGLSYDMLFGEKHLVRPELIYRSAGARSDINNIPLRWELHYLDLNVSYSYQIYGGEKFQLYQGVGPSMGILMGGEQQMGQFVYDVVETESLKRIDLGVNFMAHAKFMLTDDLFLSLEYRYGLGLGQIESNVNQTTEQISRNRYHGAIVGLSFNL